MAEKKKAKKKAAKKKKAAAKKVSHKKRGPTEVEEVLVDGPADEEAEPEAPKAIASEPTCYSRSGISRRGEGSGQSQHMTIAEHNKKFGDGEEEAE